MCNVHCRENLVVRREILKIGMHSGTIFKVGEGQIFEVKNGADQNRSNNEPWVTFPFMHIRCHHDDIIRV